MSFETATPPEAQIPFDPVLCNLMAGDADLRKLVPPGLSADRSGILYAYYGVAWLSLNNVSGRSKIDLLEKDQIRLVGQYDFSHFGRTGSGTFAYQVKLLPRGHCELSVRITGTLTFELKQAGTYVVAEEPRFLRCALADKTEVRQQAHGSNPFWYPHFKIDIQTEKELFQLAWENRPA